MTSNELFAAVELRLDEKHPIHGAAITAVWRTLLNSFDVQEYKHPFRERITKELAQSLK